AGARSEPATLALFTNNIAPSVSIISPTPSSLLRAQTTQSVCIVWQGIDPDGIHTQKPVKYRFLLLDLDDPENLVFLVNPDSLRRHAVETNWASWDSTSADTEHVAYTNLIPGKSYLFTVTGIDEVGDYDPIFNLNKNMLQFTANSSLFGPTLTIRGPAFRFDNVSPVVAGEPPHAIETEVAAGGGVTFEWSAPPSPFQIPRGTRWVLDPVDPFDETPRSGPGDVRHWSEWGDHSPLTLGPFDPAGFKREEHTLYVGVRTNPSTCVVDSSDFTSMAVVHFVVVKPMFAKDLLVVDDTRLEPDKIGAGGCPKPYTLRWPSAAELDTFLYARGGVPWRCTKNPTTGVLSTPGVFAGYAFDTLG